MLTFYYAAETCALASHIAFEEAGAAYRTVRIDFATAQQRSPEYLAINPKGRVPVLVTERGNLTETPAILAFIAQTYPRADLRRSTTSTRSRACRNSMPISARLSMSRTRTACAAIAGSMTKPPSRRCSARRRKPSANCFALIERMMFQGPFVMGARYTILRPVSHSPSRNGGKPTASTPSDFPSSPTIAAACRNAPPSSARSRWSLRSA